MSIPVPYLSDEVIERDAAALLAEYAQARGTAIIPSVPIENIVEKHLKIGIEFDDTHRVFGVPRSGLGLEPDILGAMLALSPRSWRRTARQSRRLSLRKGFGTWKQGIDDLFDSPSHRKIGGGR
jgi:hypothetical protein